MSRVLDQNSLTPLWHNNLNFRLARDQVVCASQRQANHFLAVSSIFDLGGITYRTLTDKLRSQH